MSEFLFEISLFGGKIILVLILFGGLAMMTASALAEHKKTKKRKLEIEDLGGQLKQDRLTVLFHTRTPKEFKQEIKTFKKQKKEELKTAPAQRAYVLDFKGDITASQVKLLREEVSILLKSANPKKDEVVVRLTNRGGLVPNHGLGASQLQRLRDKGFRLTVCVDETAGSGGYLMACTAHQILAAPFALIGSIGVLAQIPNFYRWLKKQDVDFEEHTAGQHKRTLTLFGQATDEKRQKLQEQLTDIHTAFKNYVIKHRPHLDLAKTATGDCWLGEQALKLGLIDGLSTSDDYILSLLEHKKVYHLSLKAEEPKGLAGWLSKKGRQNKDLLLSLALWIKKLLTKKL